ncbi:MAG: pentapeptide repeat-containing protein [Gammaproteobacteria bacterium]|nr:pentapeptide repeat-containing protein [Gammaproteobacteria bacterium]
MTVFDAKQKEYLSIQFNCLDLSYEEISATNFESCIFTDCLFTEAVFDKCKFVDCQFLKCNMSVINPGYSKFLDVIFDQCKLVGVDWTKAAWSSFVVSSPINFYKCILNDSSFFGLTLEEISIKECKAHDVDFREGNFSEANFAYTDFTNSLFNRTKLMGADFTEATSYDIDIYLNEIKRAKFSRFEAIRLLDSLEVELLD